MLPPWSTEDPREHIGKRDRIVVVAGDYVLFADVETKHGYSVILDHDYPDWRRLIDVDDEWPGWPWVRAPRYS